MDISSNCHISIIATRTDLCRSRKDGESPLSLLRNFLIDYIYISSINVGFPIAQFIRQTTPRQTAENTSQVASKSLAYVYRLRLFCHLDLAPPN